MKKYLGFLLYIGIVALFTVPILITPFLAQNSLNLFNSLQALYAPTCHQLAERSLCYFTNGTISDCAQPGIIVIGRQAIVELGGTMGYKFPVCARDLAIYGAMLLGGLVFPFVRKIDDRIAPPLIYFIIALIPIGLDGGTQLIGLRESTNSLRLITGFLSGVVIPFYMIPILNMFILGRDYKETKKK